VRSQPKGVRGRKRSAGDSATKAALGLGTPEPHEALRPGATPEAVRKAVSGRGETVVIVGHQPDCGQIAAALGDGTEPRFPPAGVHVVDLPA
jgi:phosphohistidine phosphatase SixA